MLQCFNALMIQCFNDLMIQCFNDTIYHIIIALYHFIIFALVNKLSELTSDSKFLSFILFASSNYLCIHIERL